MVALPASAETIICFAQDVANRVKSYKTVYAAVSAVKKLHMYAGMTTRMFKTFDVVLTLRGIARKCTHITKQASAMTPDLLIRMHDKLDMSQPRDAVFWWTCLLAFFLLLRKSNLLPNKISGFDASRHLIWSDIARTTNNLVVGIRWSKTDQFGRELKSFPLPIIPGSVLCPLRAAQNVIRLTKPVPGAHVAALPTGGSLTYNQFQNRLRGVLAEVEVDNPVSFSSHSFRRGGATFAYICGVPAEIIKLLGNWKSDCYLRYLHLPLEARLAASELVKMRILYTDYEF